MSASRAPPSSPSPARAPVHFSLTLVVVVVSAVIAVVVVVGSVVVVASVVVVESSLWLLVLSW
jgi:hypothetical protein